MPIQYYGSREPFVAAAPRNEIRFYFINVLEIVR